QSAAPSISASICLEGAGFEPSVPHPIFNGFEASSELGPNERSYARRLSRAVAVRPTDRVRGRPFGEPPLTLNRAARPRAGALSARRANCGTERWYGAGGGGNGNFVAAFIDGVPRCPSQTT